MLLLSQSIHLKDEEFELWSPAEEGLKQTLSQMAMHVSDRQPTSWETLMTGVEATETPIHFMIII